ncbi:unnamed protein product [Pneumocystis jirovecii]|uniref:Uncharacterized protein n=1 Tax=Pneumocystis jirovecii TaxID=42068 RepID=L0P8S0_PNEJI|nr:unnamed protein product [Pneumocystis jirovecii]
MDISFSIIFVSFFIKSGCFVSISFEIVGVSAVCIIILNSSFESRALERNSSNSSNKEKSLFFILFSIKQRIYPTISLSDRYFSPIIISFSLISLSFDIDLNTESGNGLYPSLVCASCAKQISPEFVVVLSNVLLTKVNAMIKDFSDNE